MAKNMLHCTQNFMHSWMNIAPACQNNRKWLQICKKTYTCVIRWLMVKKGRGKETSNVNKKGSFITGFY